MRHREPSGRLVRRRRLDQRRDVGAGALQDRQEAGSSGIQPDPLQLDRGTPNRRGSDAPEGRRREVPGHVDIRARQLAASRQLDDRSLHADVRAEAPHGQFRVVAGRLEFRHARRARRAEAGQQDGALDLRARHLRHVVNGLEGAATDGHRQTPAVGLDARPHPAERLDDAAHRPAPERVVAGQRGREGKAGENAGEQPGGGTRIAGIERRVRGTESRRATSDNSDDVSRARELSPRGLPGTRAWTGSPPPARTLG